MAVVRVSKARLGLAGLLALVFVGSAGGAAGQVSQAAASQHTPPQITAVYVDQAPLIDGRLDDQCWSKAARLEGFFVQNQDRSVPDETVGLICVDSEAIYVGFVCKDRVGEAGSEAGAIQAVLVWSFKWEVGVESARRGSLRRCAHWPLLHVRAPQCDEDGSARFSAGKV